MNGVKGAKPEFRKWGRLLDAVLEQLQLSGSKIDHSIYVKVYPNGTISYLSVLTYQILQTTTNNYVFE